MNKDKTLVIHEMFSSIQGESTHAGRPCFFIRLTGCPLRCNWCDTEYAFTGGTRMSIPEILDQVKESGLSLVEVTGGEPLAQPGCPELCEILCESGFEVLLETAGTHSIENLPEKVKCIMDIKCPGSGETDRFLWQNISCLKPIDEVKFVLCDYEDYQWAKEVLETYKLHTLVHAVLFAPVFGVLEPAELARWILTDKLPVRMQIQMHKVIWDPATRGV